jgi:aminoglycoside phosphotransferase (APT) family kinase protein
VGIENYVDGWNCPINAISRLTVHHTGHPYADLTNLIQPWTISTSTPSWPRVHADTAFLPSSHPKSTSGSFPGLPTKAEAVQWYSETAGFEVPDKELAWATAFALFRDSVIFQGIAARYAVRQASSDKAMTYGKEMKPFAEMAWEKLKETESQGKGSKL